MRFYGAFSPHHGKSVNFRLWLLSWWKLWEHGYRGPMPYVVGPGWKPPKKPLTVFYDD